MGTASRKVYEEVKAPAKRELSSALTSSAHFLLAIQTEIVNGLCHWSQTSGNLPIINNMKKIIPLFIVYLISMGYIKMFLKKIFT